MEQHNQKGLLVPQNQINRISKSADYTVDISRCYENKIEKQQYIVQLKQKAHKSFLQVIQMQHLHQQQICQLTEQYQEREKEIQQKSLQLQNKVLNLQNQLKITHKHILQISNTSFTIDNIDIIHYKQNDQSKFQEFSFLHLKELLTGRQNQTTEKIKKIKADLLRQLSNSNDKQGKKIENIVNNIFLMMNQMSEQNSTLQEKLDESNRILSSLQNQFKSLKIQYQSSQKQAKFLSDHLKRVISDKNLLQKKYNDSDKNAKILEQYVRNYKRIFQQHGIKPALLKNDLNINSCTNLQLSAFTNKIFNLDDLDSSQQSLSMKTDNFLLSKNYQKPFKMTTQHNKPLINPLKNFRKQKNIDEKNK